MRIFPAFLFVAMGLNVPLKKNVIKNIGYNECKNYIPPKLLAKNNEHDEHDEETDQFPDPIRMFLLVSPAAFLRDSASDLAPFGINFWPLSQPFQLLP